MEARRNGKVLKQQTQRLRQGKGLGLEQQQHHQQQHSDYDIGGREGVFREPPCSEIDEHWQANYDAAMLALREAKQRIHQSFSSSSSSATASLSPSSSSTISSVQASFQEAFASFSAPSSSSFSPSSFSAGPSSAAVNESTFTFVASTLLPFEVRLWMQQQKRERSQGRLSEEKVRRLQPLVDIGMFNWDYDPVDDSSKHAVDGK